MASAIHHGAPGSYKSFSVVQRFAIPALLGGRVVITNIRGFDSKERILDAFPDYDFPPEAQLYFFDTSTRDARMIMACWYRWIPVGTLLIIDEAQTIYPDRLDFKLESLDKFEIPPEFTFQIEDTKATIGESRPPDVFTAFDKQRHYNWDIFLTTTNVSKIKRDIRESSEWAYRHRSLSELSLFFKDTWYEHQHDPENNGKSDSHRVGKPKKYKADKRVFKCYQSTATGEHIASQAGTKLFDDSGIKIRLYLMGFILCAALFLAYLSVKPHKTVMEAGLEDTKPSVSTPITIDSASSDNTVKATNYASNSLHTVKNDSLVALSPDWHIAGRIQNKSTHKEMIIISDSFHHAVIISINDCKEDAFKQLTCQFRGQTVTHYSGVSGEKAKNVLASSFK